MPRKNNRYRRHLRASETYTKEKELKRLIKNDKEQVEHYKKYKIVLEELTEKRNRILSNIKGTGTFVEVNGSPVEEYYWCIPSLRVSLSVSSKFANKYLAKMRQQRKYDKLHPKVPSSI